MKKINFFIVIAILMVISFFRVNAQVLPGSYTTSWVGNTFVPTPNAFNFVQNWANSMFVESDGTIYANANWDEGAKELGIYKNGQCIGAIPNQHEHADGGAITTNATYIWFSAHNGQVQRINKSGYGEAGAAFTVSTSIVRGLAATATELYISDYAANKIKVYNAATSASLRSWSVTRPGHLAFDATGNVWVISSDANPWGPSTGACIKCYSSTGSLLKTITLAAGVKGKSIAVDKIKNELLVTDISDNMQVHIYGSINATPVFLESFGTQGGILSGTKGVVAPLKLNVPCLVGVDGSSNIIIWSNGNNPDPAKKAFQNFDYDGMGTSVESYTRAGARNWQMLGLEFVDMGTFDPSTDGADLYTKHEHFTMDYSKPDGQQWIWKGWSLDRTTYANSDIRLKNGPGHLGGTLMRTIGGNRYMYINSMSGGGFSFFRFTASSEIAIPCGEVLKNSQWNDNNGNGQKDAGESTTNVLWNYDMFGNYVDANGDIWFVYDDIRKHTRTGISNLAPTYNATPVITTTPAPFNSLRRIEYDSNNDIMYLSGYTAAKPYTNDWKSCGLVMARYNNWSTGNRTALYTINLPSKPTEISNMVSVTVEKDYIFAVGVETRAKVWVYNSSNGALIGTMDAGANIGGNAKTGWCDLVNSIAAFKKSNGEYLVTVEEDFFAKIIIYRWNPGIPVTGVSVSPTTASVAVGGTAQITATVTPSNATNKNVTWTTSNSAVATVSTSGLVSGVSAGSTIITATTQDGAKIATSAITVTSASSSTHEIRLEVISGWNYVQSFKYYDGSNWITVNYNDASINTNFTVHNSGWLESQTTGSYVELTFSGTSIQLIGKNETYGGTGKIYIDGIYQQDVSFNGLSTSNVLIYEKTGLSVCGLVEKVDDVNTRITYSGTWNANTSPDRNGGTWHESNQIGSYAQFTFCGSQVELIAEKQSYGGSADVYIDDIYVTGINFYNATSMLQQTLYKNSNLSNTTHTIKIVSTIGNWIYIDAILINGAVK